jgi:4-deoxy-L-threo-5-hexosulose-uronate ketol-isomerase
MRTYQLADQVRFPHMSTEELRQTFLVQNLFQPGTVEAVYIDLDRAVLGSVVPTVAPITLPVYEELRATYFTERRELGVLNIGNRGAVEVDGTYFTLENLDCLYVGRGSERVVFRSQEAGNPAEFYLLSYPSHAAHPTTLIKSATQEPTLLGAPEACNQRQITKLIYLDGAASSQLVMGFTQLASGSAWNTMPPHTHMRRSEIYLYFNIAENDRVLHLMGPPHETRHLVVANKQAIVSPGWSIHAGVGTRNYTFCWGMGGENQVYSDMDPVSIADLH